MNITKVTFLLTFILFLYTTKGWRQNKETIHNPIDDGYFTDPLIIKYQWIYYIYSAIYLWEGDEFGVFETKIFKYFLRKHIE
jgi:hypothetical protein